MKIARIVFTIADNGVSGQHFHVELNEALSADVKLWDTLRLRIGIHEPQTFYLTGIRSPPSEFCTVQSTTERGSALHRAMQRGQR